ncbi:DUF937 domain-containing protein [Caminibacter mediatlanticus TB-2]|uniref:DUF937 domain-containing protein n=1 Tax=Caminibacter mediatlanticus TB-2 TaxID=391592 RepID=A0ABX5V743_9BACT|nr:YidB family protein [Caminibacter mediatlanticus]QCT94093.1 DUF937 domain-containing protein [Caminibacter mediatlanticus TB-2]
MNTQMIMQVVQSYLQNNKTFGNLDINSVVNGIQGLLGGIDIKDLLSKFASNGLGDIVSSWLGSGENKSIDASVLIQALPNEKIEEFASKVGLPTDKAGELLSGVLPQIVDKVSNEDSSLIDSVLGGSGLGDTLKKFF